MASGSGWNIWVWLLGVVVGRYIDFLTLLIPTPLVYFLFCSSIPTFVHFFNVFLQRRVKNLVLQDCFPCLYVLIKTSSI